MTSYLNAILDPQATHLPRLSCPQLDTTRYDYLKAVLPEQHSTVQYFFALDLRQCLGLLPRLIGSVVEVIKFLGPEQCALSIIEGPSEDGTDEVLAALRPGLDALTTTYYFKHTNLSSKVDDRIAKLAELRNMALQPLLAEEGRYSSNTTVIFLNDVAACHEDILELVHQRKFLGADMTCAMDWTYAGRDPTFYDVWIARGMNGDTFFNIPTDGSWNSAWNLFWNNPEALSRFSSHQPFQVFSCWNGAVVFTAKPIVEKSISFRAPNKEAGECHQGEPQLFCKDMWFHGYGKIATVPSVNLEYSDEQAKKIKDAKGYTSTWVGEGHPDETINWQLAPPERVKCMQSWEDQFWQAWNQTLT